MGGVVFQNVTKSAKRGAPPLLRNLNIDFDAERSTAILSTQSVSLRSMINLISGATRPTAGRVVRTCSVSFPVAYAQGLNRHVSGLQNTTFIARIYGADISATVDFVQRFSELGDALNNRLSSYSPEQRVQFFLALSYAVPFDLYISNGTLIGGSPHFREKCKRYLHRLRKRAGLIVTTKNLQIAKLFCDRAVVLHMGEATTFGDVASGIAYFTSIRNLEQTTSSGFGSPEPAGGDDEADDLYEGF